MKITIAVINSPGAYSSLSLNPAKALTNGNIAFFPGSHIHDLTYDQVGGCVADIDHQELR